MIYHASMRTDIPAFYSRWLFNRIRAGWFAVRNPYNDRSVTAHSLQPNVVDLLMFCTKDPQPMLSHLEMLRPYRQSWHVTVTSYGRDIEPNVPPIQNVIKAVRYLSETIGADRVAWRYDPIILTQRYPIEHHIRSFDRIASDLSGYVSSVIISFAVRYPKLRVLAPFISETAEFDKRIVISKLSGIARKHNMPIKLCAEPHIYDSAEIDQTGCESEAGLEAKIGYRIRLPITKPKRPHCTCYLGLDMGAYNSCPHLCRYCYANSQPHIVASSFNDHNPDSPILIGQAEDDPNDFRIANDKSYRLDGVLF